MCRKISREPFKGEGPGFMCSVSLYIWLGDGSSVRTAVTYTTEEQLDKENICCNASGEKEKGNKGCVVGKIVKSRMKWAGHLVRINDERFAKIYETKK